MGRGVQLGPRVLWASQSWEYCYEAEVVLRVRGTKALLWGGGGSYRGPEDSWEQAVETAHPALEWVTAVHLQEKWC